MQWQRTGTVTVTNGSATVTGASTLWSDVGTLNPGDIFTSADGKLYEILTINSNTGITLNSVYLGSSLSGQAYSIMPIGLLPSTLAQQVKTTLATANTALASTVRYDISTMGLSLTQQQNARTNIAALSAFDVGAGVQTVSVAGGVDVTLTAVQASGQLISLTGTLTANINVIVPAAVRMFMFGNNTTGAFTVTIKTAGASGVKIAQGQQSLIGCNGSVCFDSITALNSGLAVQGSGGSSSVLSTTAPSVNGVGIAITNSTSGTYASLNAHGATGNSVANWPNSFVVESVPVSTGGLVLSSYSGNISFQTNARTTQATLDASGNLGLGVTPSAWSATKRALQVGTMASITSDSATAAFANNTYINSGGTTIYQTTNYATYYYQSSGQHVWQTAPSGTAGNPITFTQAMTLDASGNLLLNPIANGGITLQQAAGQSFQTIAHITGTASGTSYSSFFYNGIGIGSINQSGTTAVVYTTTSDHRLKTNVRDANAARFMDIQFRDFEWVDGRHDCGVIAHELQAVYPDLVTGVKDATEVRSVEITPAVAAVVDAEGVEITPAVTAVTEDQTFPVYQQVNYTGLICRMGVTIQKQQALIESLTARLTSANIA